MLNLEIIEFQMQRVEVLRRVRTMTRILNERLQPYVGQLTVGTPEFNAKVAESLQGLLTPHNRGTRIDVTYWDGDRLEATITVPFDGPIECHLTI